MTHLPVAPRPCFLSCLDLEARFQVAQMLAAHRFASSAKKARGVSERNGWL